MNTRIGLAILCACLLAASAAGCGDGGNGDEDVTEEDARPDTDASDDGNPGDDAVEPDPPADDLPLDDGAPDGPDTPDSPDAPDGEDLPDGPPPEIWRPAPATSWQWQLSGTIDTSFEVEMYDIDLFETPDEVIAGLHGRGIVVICYFSAGSYEDWRPDEAEFPAAAIGNPLEGWEGESWLDTRNAEVRAIMQRRLDLAAARGCDGVEPDNMDGYQNEPGFPLDGDTQLDYNRFIAAEAHARGLSVGLKNDLDQIGDLLNDFDWTLNEECFAYDECDTLLPFIGAGKAVFQVEYGDASLADEVCPQANAMDFDTLIKNLDLDAWRVACR
jgi:hypothetical protein